MTFRAYWTSSDCCKVTIELPAHAVAAIRVFLPPRNRSFAQTLLKLFIMRLPCIIVNFILKPVFLRPEVSIPKTLSQYS